MEQPKQKLTLQVGGTCDHEWGGPLVELTEEEHGTNGSSLSCTNCGMLAIEQALWE